MTITTRDQLINALANNSTIVFVRKNFNGWFTSNHLLSLWRHNDLPPPGAIPTAPEVCTNATLGAIDFPQQVAPTASYLAASDINFSFGAPGFLILVDRLAHMGGLNGTLTTAQTVGLDLLVQAPSAARRGRANFADVTWYLEWYTDTGATASNATVNVTYDDGTSGSLPVLAVGGTVRGSRLMPFVSAVPGRFIRAVNTVTLSASTGTAGNFGVTAVRKINLFPMVVANIPENQDWAELGLPLIPTNACLSFITQSLNIPNFIAILRIAHG